jgi:hypothetical protein
MQTFFINRFPICTMVYKRAAELQGHNPEFAKSLGLARAVFFAAAKKGFKNKSEKGYNGLSQDENMPEIYSMTFAGIDAFCMETPNGTRSCLLDGKIFEPQSYDKQDAKIIASVGEVGLQKMEQEIDFRLRKLGDKINSGSVYNVYASLRDKVRSTQFINS